MATKSNSDNQGSSSPTKYPAFTLEFCLEMGSKVLAHGGNIHPVTKKDICLFMDRSEGYMIQAFPACEQYRILKKEGVGAYMTTDEFGEIDSPTFEEDRRKALLRAMQSPPLYKSLIEDLNGQKINMEGLINHLKRKYKLIQGAAEKVAFVFFQNAEYLSLFDNGKFKFISASMGVSAQNKAKEKEDVIDEKPQDEKPAKGRRNQDEDEFIDPDFMVIPIPDPTTKQTAKVILPIGYGDDLLDRISKVILAYKSNPGADSPR